MSVPQKKFVKRCRRSLFLDIVLSLYLTGFFNTVTKTYTLRAALNPFSQLKQAKATGQPIGLFLVIFLFLSCAFAYYLIISAKDIKGMDKMGRRFKQTKNRQSYGDAHFEEPDEYKDVASVQRPENVWGVIVGQIGSDGQKVVNLRMDNNRGNRHIAVVGASGSGKTFTFSKPYCYQCVRRRESVILTDPDGGLYRDLAGYFEDNGYVVRRFDLTNLKKSDGWHCMNSISPENAELDAQVFAQAIISNVAQTKNTGDIYVTGPLSLLKALVLRVYLGPDFDPERKNIKEVYALLQDPKGEEALDEWFDPALMPVEARPSLGPYLSFKESSPNLRGNIIVNLATQLQLFQNEMVCKVLSTDDIDLTLPGQKPCAYFCLFPDSHDTFQFIVSLFFSMLLQNLVAYADQKCGGQLPVPVNFLLDEFPSIGKLPDWDKKMATIRKRQMNAVMIFQNLSQLQNLYDLTWNTIFSNCGTHIILGINDGDTADLFTKRIGDTTIQAETEQHPINESLLAFSHNHSTGEGRRALLSYDELHKLDKDDCIVIPQTHNPIWLRKYPHTLHPEAAKTRKILPSSIPDITDTEARKARKKAEEERIEAYYKKHPKAKYVKYEPEDFAGLCESDDYIEDKPWIQQLMIKAAEKLDKTKKNPIQQASTEEFVLIEEADELPVESVEPDESSDFLPVDDTQDGLDALDEISINDDNDINFSVPEPPDEDLETPPEEASSPETSPTNPIQEGSDLQGQESAQHLDEAAVTDTAQNVTGSAPASSASTGEMTGAKNPELPEAETATQKPRLEEKPSESCAANAQSTKESSAPSEHREYEKPLGKSGEYSGQREPQNRAGRYPTSAMFNFDNEINRFDSDENSPSRPTKIKSSSGLPPKSKKANSSTSSPKNT